MNNRCSECEKPIPRQPHESDAIYTKRVTCGSYRCRKQRSAKKQRLWHEKHGKPTPVIGANG